MLHIQTSQVNWQNANVKIKGENHADARFYIKGNVHSELSPPQYNIKQAFCLYSSERLQQWICQERPNVWANDGVRIAAMCLSTQRFR
jgi:hypothetical protein